MRSSARGGVDLLVRSVPAARGPHGPARVWPRRDHALAQAMRGPERPTGRGRIAAVSNAVPPTVPPADADEAGIAQVIEATMRRGAGVAEQGCLLSSYTG